MTPLREWMAALLLASAGGMAAAGCDDGACAPGYPGLDAAMDAAASAVTGPADAAAACPPPALQECPGPAPSFAATIVPILDASCNGCHDPSTPDAPWPLRDYDNVVDWRTAIVADLLACSMPPAGSGVTLSETDRQQILTWVVCRTPRN